MVDEKYRRAILKVASQILVGIATALLLEIPLTNSWQSLTTNIILCILNTIAPVQIERFLQE